MSISNHHWEYIQNVFSSQTDLNNRMLLKYKIVKYSSSNDTANRTAFIVSPLVQTSYIRYSTVHVVLTNIMTI